MAITKKQKIEYGEIKFNKLEQKYDITIIENASTYIVFSLGKDEYNNKNTYHYNKEKMQIRNVNETEWTGKIITKFKEDFNGMIPEIDKNKVNKELENKTAYFQFWFETIDIDDCDLKVTIPTRNFLFSIKEQIEKNKTLSIKQLKIMEDIKSKIENKGLDKKE